MKGSVSFLFALALTGAVAADAPVVPAVLDLETSLALALEHNYAIRQARAFYAQNTGAVMTSESGRLPTVTGFGGYTQIDPGLVSIPGGRENSWQAGVQASQIVYSGGAVSSSIKSSRLTRDAAELGFAEAVQSALLQVRIRWYAVLLAREQVGVQEQFIVLLEEELANARSRVNAGSGSPFEQLRAEVALANGQPGLIRARNAYRVAAVDLLREIGLPSDESTADKVIGELQYVPREVPLETALGSAQANRPEIRRLENLVTAAEANIDTARAGTRPTVAVVGGYTVEQAQLSGADDTIEGWTVGAQASWGGR